MVTNEAGLWVKCITFVSLYLVGRLLKVHDKVLQQSPRTGRADVPLRRTIVFPEAHGQLQVALA